MLYWFIYRGENVWFAGLPRGAAAVVAAAANEITHFRSEMVPRGAATEPARAGRDAVVHSLIPAAAAARHSSPWMTVRRGAARLATHNFPNLVLSLPVPAGPYKIYLRMMNFLCCVIDYL